MTFPESERLMRENLYILLLMLLTVPLAGELKFHPFNDEFRVSFGTTAFSFFLLWSRRIPPVVSGILVGTIVVLFRLILDWISQDTFQLGASFMLHFPTFFFYLMYASLFHLARINHYHHRPLLVGLLCALVEIIANMMELAIRNPDETLFTLSVVGKISSIAFIRSFFVLSFLNMIELRQAKLMEEQQRSRNEHLLMLIANLYEESILLHKSQQNAEEITRDCYDLYRSLKEKPRMEGFSQRALKIAGQVHEIKKDNQRIYAGLSKIITNEHLTDFMNIEELVEIIVRTHERYARMLHKEVSFECNIHVFHSHYHIYTTLSIINNLVSNAVESIKEKGMIRLSILETAEWVEFIVADNGPGIAVKDHDLLFKPGFTTKYDDAGRPSTGIGLSYVKELVDSLNGTIEVQSKTQEDETVFHIRLPKDSILKEMGDEHALFHSR